jgi:serine/threonine protein kinase
MDDFPVKVIRDTYIIKKWLGKGKFGVVYHAENMTNGEQVAIKMEKTDTEYSSIKHEVRMMNYLFQHGFRDLPKIHWYGVEQTFTYLAMCYYDRSLESVVVVEFSSLAKIMIQCITILESIHELYVIHRDIKPHNFMIKNQQLYLIDYGLATFYMDEEGEHLPNKHQETITGTPLYLSYYNYLGNTLSRRDDLISLGYMFLYLFTGSLPWSEALRSENRRFSSASPPNTTHFEGDTATTIHLKSMENITQLSYDDTSEKFKKCFDSYMDLCYQLQYDEKPHYINLMKLFTV